MFTLISFVLLYAAPGHAEGVAEVRTHLLELTAQTAREGLSRGTEVTREAYEVNVAAWAELFRQIGVTDGMNGLWLNLSDHRYVFPKLAKDFPDDILPMLVARQTRVFSWLAWRAAELSHDRPRQLDWRAEFFGRTLDKLRTDLEHELFEYARRRHAGAPYAAAELRGLLAVADEVAGQTPWAAVRQSLRRITRASSGRGFVVSPSVLRRSLVQALGHVHVAVERRDRIACTEHLTRAHPIH